MKKQKKASHKKSALAREAERLFSNPGPEVDLNPPPAYIGDQKIVQSVTTYSACEDPVPNLYRRQ